MTALHVQAVTIVTSNISAIKSTTGLCPNDFKAEKKKNSPFTDTLQVRLAVV